MFHWTLQNNTRFSSFKRNATACSRVIDLFHNDVKCGKSDVTRRLIGSLVLWSQSSFVWHRDFRVWRHYEKGLLHWTLKSLSPLSFINWSRTSFFSSNSDFTVASRVAISTYWEHLSSLYSGMVHDQTSLCFSVFKPFDITKVSLTKKTTSHLELPLKGLMLPLSVWIECTEKIN